MFEVFKLMVSDLEGNHFTLHYRGSQADATDWAEELFITMLSAENIQDRAELMDSKGQTITYIGD